MVSEFLFYEEDASVDEKSNYVNLKIEIRQLLKDDFNRKILSEVLLDLRKDVSGETQKRLFKLYKDLGLHNGDFKKLRSWRWEIVSKGILNLTQMQVDEAYGFVTKFINDKRATIRKQAEIAVVTLKSEGINHFLDTTKYKISEWQQLKLLDVLRNEEDYQPPRFKAWLTSTNRHVVLFALRLIKFYNQNDADAALIELVKHKNSQIKEEAIGCIKEFHITRALPTLKLVFWKSTIDVKIAILDAIGDLGTESEIEFLQLIEKKESNFSVRSKAYSSINAISPDSIMPSKGLVNTENYKIPEDIKIEEQEEEIWEGEFEIEENSQMNSKDEDITLPIDVTIDEVKINLDTETKEQQKSKIVNTLNDNQNENKNRDLNIDFLPFIVNDIKTTKEDNFDNSNILVDDMTVHFEEVSFENKIAKSKKADTSLEITEEEIAFLPIVTDVTNKMQEVNKKNEEAKSKRSINQIEVQFEELQPKKQKRELGLSADNTKYQNSEILETKVIYEEISKVSDEIQENISDEEYTKIPKSPQSQNDMNSKDELIFKKILKDLVSFDEPDKIEENTKEFVDLKEFEFEVKFVDANEVYEMNEEIDEELENKPTISALSIPKAIFSDDTLDDILLFREGSDESRVQLLDAISEMGDQREIPYLKEMLDNEKFVLVKDRIVDLIGQFSKHDNKPSLNLLKPFNVFEDLFRTCDTEAKLILMDEIVSVGDEAEFSFLESLLEDDVKEISNKAARVLEELRLKLSPNKDIETEAVLKTEVLIKEETLTAYDSMMDELQIASPQASEIFELTFELNDPKSVDKENEVEESPFEVKIKHGSLIDQWCNFSTKLIDRLNG